jgi:hypothetical protein
MSVVSEVIALLNRIEGALDSADFEHLTAVGVVSPDGDLPGHVEAAELQQLLDKTLHLRARVAAAMAGVQSELRSVGSTRVAGRAYLANQGSMPVPFE